ACTTCALCSVISDEKIRCPVQGCEDDNFLDKEYRKSIDDHRREWITVGMLEERRKTISRFVLKIQNIQDTPLLLSKETTVVLDEIVLSFELLLKLLEKTKVSVVGKISVFSSPIYEDCIIPVIGTEHGDVVLRISSFPDIKHDTHFFKNTNGIPPSSIACKCGVVLLEETPLVCMIPKLKIAKGNVMELFSLNIRNEENITELFIAEDRSIYLGRIKKLVLKNYAVLALPKIELCGDNEVEGLYLSAEEMYYVSGITRAEDSIYVGRVKRLKLLGYAISTLPKIELHEDNEMDELLLDAEKIEYVSGIVRAKDSIYVGRINNMKLLGYAVNTLPKIKLHEDNEMERLYLDVKETVNVSGITSAEDTIWIGRVKKLVLRNYATSILPRIKLHEDNEMEELVLYAEKEQNVSEIIRVRDNSIWVGRVKKLVLSDYAVNTLPKIKVHEDNEMEDIHLYAEKERNVSEIIRARDSSIWVGRVKKLVVFGYAINTLPKIRLHGDNEIGELKIVGVSKRMLWRREGDDRDSHSEIVVKKTFIRPMEFVFSLLTKRKVGEAETLGETGTVVKDEDGCCSWKIKEMKIEHSTMFVLRWLRTDRSCVLDRFEVVSKKKMIKTCHLTNVFIWEE
ncbi:MAG: uncharacterized protein A8A55_2172, partial [Amphiamblys sp. WSBS2006]